MMKKWQRLLSLITLLAGLCACQSLAVYFAPEKTPLLKDSALAKQAAEQFWTTFHTNHYEDLSKSLRLLTAAYLENPRDPKTTLLLAMAHYWKLVERNRAPEKDPQITDDAILAERYLQEAYRLNPNDGRLLGFLGGIKLALGNIHQDVKLTRQGYFLIQDGIHSYPEFNYFVESYLFSRLPKTDKNFDAAVEAVWKNVEVCVGEKISGRSADDLREMTKKFLASASTLSQDKRRACLNSWIAPHNFEGFCMHWGDILVKKGDVKAAKAAYEFATLAEAYPTWRFRDLLQERIRDAEKNAHLFDDPDEKKHPELMINSTYACVGCHAE